jgi:flagellar protein FliS
MSRPQSAYQTTQLTGMSPGKLVEALLDGALAATTRAIVAAEDGQTARRGESVSKALTLVGELQTALDLEAGDLATNLYALYDYVQRELLEGNMRVDKKRFENAERILGEIHEGWCEMLAVLEREQLAEAPPPEPGATSHITDYA